MFTVNWLYFDPLDQERVIGWGVYRKSPWDLVGVYPTEYIAREKAVSYGCDYLVSLALIVLAHMISDHSCHIYKSAS